MKLLDQLKEKLEKDPALAQQLAQTKGLDECVQLLRSVGVQVTQEELARISTGEGVLEDDALDQVSGGFAWRWPLSGSDGKPVL